jgi:dolichol-phosphate mannosyltransferase
MPETSRILVAIPTYNESDNIERIVRAVLEHLSHAHVLVIDDSSPDGTGLIADRLAAQDSRVQVLHRPTKAGLGSAYLTAFRWALQRNYDAVIEMDADFSHDPADLPRLVHAAQDADVVIGSRYVAGGSVENWALGRRLLSKAGNLYASLALGLPIRDSTAGFRLYTSRALEALDLSEISTNGYAFQVEMTYRAFRAGLEITEIPIVFVDRRVGKSKMSRKIVVEALLWVAKEAVRSRLENLGLRRKAGKVATSHRHEAPVGASSVWRKESRNQTR